MKNLPLLFLFGLSGHLFAQNTTTPAAALLRAEEAVQIALANNYDIRLVQGDAETARLNNTKGNAGMLPNVNLLVSDNVGLNIFQQQNLADGRVIEAYGRLNNNALAAVQLNWTLFDGHRMQITKKRLEELEALGQLDLKSTVQQTTAGVLLAYYNIVQSRLLERSVGELISLNEERLRIAEARLAAGFAAQTDALQARIDLNQQRSNLLNQQNTTAAAKRNLNQFLARAPETPFEVVETLDNTYTPQREQLLQNVLSQNPELLSLQKNAEVAALLVDENRKLSKPRISGVGQYNLQRTDNGAGFLLNNTQSGLVVGASLTLPLYTGGNIQRQVDVARVGALQASVRVDARRLAIETELNHQLAFFQTQQQMLGLETDNIKNARESLQVSTERFRLGQTNALEVQLAQNTLEQALFRQNVVLYNLKTAEVQLRLLSGEL
ncbi:MAG: TolC family protein [Saprospiraceae bacterium]|nr:TolC family protein [Saprospiraceae bacterium]